MMLSREASVAIASFISLKSVMRPLHLMKLMGSRCENVVSEWTTARQNVHIRLRRDFIVAIEDNAIAHLNVNVHRVVTSTIHERKIGSDVKSRQDIDLVNALKDPRSVTCIENVK